MGFQPKPKRVVTLTSISIILDITKTESNNCFSYTLNGRNMEVIFVHSSSLTGSNTKRVNLT